MHLPRRTMLATLIVLCRDRRARPARGRPLAGGAAEPGRERVPTPLDRVLRRGPRHRRGHHRLSDVHEASDRGDLDHRRRRPDLELPDDVPCRARASVTVVPRRHRRMGAGGDTVAAQRRRRSDVVDPSQSRRLRSDLRHRHGRMGDPARHGVLEGRRDVGRRRHLERGPRPVPARSEGRHLRHPHVDRRRLGRLRRRRRRGIVAAGRVEDDRWRHDVDARLPRRRTERRRVPLPRRRPRLAVALQLRRPLPLHGWRNHVERPRFGVGRQRPRRGRVVRLRHERLRDGPSVERFLTTAHERRRWSSWTGVVGFAA